MNNKLNLFFLVLALLTIFILVLIIVNIGFNLSSNFKEFKESCEGYYGGQYNGTSCNNINIKYFGERSNNRTQINPFPEIYEVIGK